MSDTPKDSTEKLTKQERCLQVAQTRYVFRRDGRGPYLLLGEQRYSFGKGERRRLSADLRHAWREKWPDEAPPADRALNSVIDDLRLLAMNAEAAPIEDDPVGGAWSGGDDLDDDEADDGLELVTALDDCPLPDGYRMPRGYQVRPDGIWDLAGRWGEARVSWAWLFPVRVYIDPDGDQIVELAWRDSGHWVFRSIRRAVIKSGRKLVMEAGDAGLPITDSESKDTERWLAAAEIANAGVISRYPVARQLGWQNDGRTFVTSQDSPWKVEPRYPQQVPALKAHRARGTLAGWQAAISKAEGYPVVQLGIYEGLAAPLLNILGLDSFTVDHAGKSSRGKTITAMGGLSCWADPSDKGDGMFSWQTSVIEAERRFNLVNGLPVVLDETRLVKDPTVVDTILYEVPKNHGKPRGGGYPSMIPWRTIVLSTGEQPATSFTTHQGASARVLSIQQAPFGSEGEGSRAVAEEIKHGIEENYGTAGPAFVVRLQKLLAEKNGAAGLKARHAELTEKLRGTTDMSGRRAPSMAAIALAAELAAAWGITPFKAPKPDALLSLFSSADDPRDNRPEMALDIVREFLAAHQERMFNGDPRDHPPASGWIGKYTKDGPALLPAIVGEELKRRGYDMAAVLPGWLEKDVLVTRSSQRPPHMIPTRIGKGTPKHLVFKQHAIDLAADDE